MAVWQHENRPSDHRVLSSGVWRNSFHAGEAVQFAVSGTCTVAGWEVRNYYGDVVATGLGDIGSSLTLAPLPLGFYTLYLTRATPVAAPWLASAGEIRFAVVRPGGPLAARPALGSLRSNEPPYHGADYPTRSFVGMGPHRTTYSLSWQHAELITTAKADTLLEQSLWAHDPVRPLRQFCHSGDSLTPENDATNGVMFQNVVSELTSVGCMRFEVMNEPNNYGVSPSRMAEMATTYQTRLKAANPAAMLLGPCSIKVRHNDWTRDVLALAGDKFDVVSFHNYNGAEGDLSHARRVLDGFVAALQSVGQAHKERINSEAFSYFQSVYGSYEPRLQAQWTMLEMHLLEQYGVPKENCSTFYDMQHGFWDYPSWWMHAEADEAHPGPLVPIVRVWSEELFGKAFTERLDFGAVGNHDLLGSRFESPSTGDSVIAVQTDGRDATVRFQVTGASSIVTVSPFGAEQSTPVVGGWVSVEVSTLPVYLRLPSGVTATPEVVNYGIGSGSVPGVTATASSAANSPSKVIDGLYENGHLDGVQEFRAADGTLPAWVRLDFDTPRRFDRIRVVCPRPWQGASAILDADVQILRDGSWVTVGTINEDPLTFQWSTYKASGACYTESYWSRTCKWEFVLDEIEEATAVRVYARAVSAGGGATPATTNGAGLSGGDMTGQGGATMLSLREVEVWLSSENGSGLPSGHTGPFLIT